MKDAALFTPWLRLGILSLILGNAVFSALTYQAAGNNQLAIAALRGATQVRTEDRYTGTDAKRDLEAIRELIEMNRQELGQAVTTRDSLFDKVLKRLDALERKMERQQ